MFGEVRARPIYWVLDLLVNQPVAAVIANGHRMNILTVPTAALSIHFPAPISTVRVSTD